MKPIPLLIASFCYFYTAWDQASTNPWWVVFWSSYGVANLAWMKATGVF